MSRFKTNRILTPCAAILCAITLHSAAPAEPVGPSLAVDWQTIDGGGGVSSAGALRLVSSIGQPDPGNCTAGTLALSGGFIPGAVDPTIPCPGDLNGDTFVDVVDLLALLGAWGPCASCPQDTNDDDVVDVVDLLALLGAWGTCPAP